MWTSSSAKSGYGRNFFAETGAAALKSGVAVFRLERILRRKFSDESSV
jgi:hypothetical protein